MMTLNGWKIQSKPHPGESMKQFLKRLTDEDPLTIQDAAVMRSKRFAKWSVNEGNDKDPTNDPQPRLED